MSQLFSPYDLAGLPLPNRTVMAPMTRSRAATGAPDAHTALYYAQRASAGLLPSTPIDRSSSLQSRHTEHHSAAASCQQEQHRQALHAGDGWYGICF